MFLPDDHTLKLEKRISAVRPELPGTHRILSFAQNLPQHRLENRLTATRGCLTRFENGIHQTKDRDAAEKHAHWISTLPDLTMLIYTDGSKFDSGSTGAGWAIYCVGNGIARLIKSGSCHLGEQMEVYDAELHAVHEALDGLTHIDTPPALAFVCIDNSAAISALNDNVGNSEPAREAINISVLLAQDGWRIHTLWTPAHVGVIGNETADNLAKLGANSPSKLCPHACTTKTWLYAESRRILSKRWKEELPSSHASLTLPGWLKNLKFSESRALFRVYCNRTPSDAYPSEPPQPCQCGQDMVSGRHLFSSCAQFEAERQKLISETFGDITSDKYFFDPRNVVHIVRFLRKTGIGFTDKILPSSSGMGSRIETLDDTDSEDLNIGDFE
jgi:ribonuclease HI